MPDPTYQPRTEVKLRQKATAYGTAEEAHEMIDSGRFDLPVGKYTITKQGRNEKSFRHDTVYGDGYYYRLVGKESSGWVWQHELAWAECTDWLAGVEINVCGPPELIDSEVGWCVIGQGELIFVTDEEEGKKVIARLQSA